jgi:hypothetical protein
VDAERGTVDYPNVPAIIGRALSVDPGLIAVLDRISVEDLHDLLEVRAIDAHNRRVIQRNLEAAEKDQ